MHGVLLVAQGMNCSEEARVLGRRIEAVDGLEASLADPGRKKRVWKQLQAAKADGPVY